MTRNGIQLEKHCAVLVISGTQISKDMSKIICPSPCRTFAFPLTVKTVDDNLFCKRPELAGVRLNEGLKKLGKSCFSSTGIRTLVVPASVNDIQSNAFAQCIQLRYADLSAAKELEELCDETFESCKNLKHVLLNDNMHTIRRSCF